MSEHRLELQVAWQQHVASGLDRFEGLLTRHREKHRRYHTITHVSWVVRHVEELTADGLDDVDLGAAVAAAFYHDAVYEPRSPASANERASARLARRDLVELGWTDDRADAVGTMIEGTATHLDPPDDTSAVLFDADLSVLAADPAGYGDYVRNVRAEYGHVVDDVWREGRTAVLHGFLERETIFATEPGRSRWEEHARANIAAELASLA